MSKLVQIALLVLFASTTKGINPSSIKAIFLGTFVPPAGNGIQSTSEYFLILNEVTFGETNSYCGEYGASAASIETADEYKFLRNEITRYGKYNLNIWTCGYYDAGSNTMLWGNSGSRITLGTWGQWATGYPIMDELSPVTFKVAISGLSTWYQNNFNERHFVLCER